MEILKSDGARTGLFFGATSGVITTIGLIVGLNSGTNSVIAVLGGLIGTAIVALYVLPALYGRFARPAQPHEQLYATESV